MVRAPWTALFVASAAASVLGPSFVAAQELDQAPPTHWAYAATFGSGVYELGDGTEVLIMRAPFAWTWRDPDPSNRCHCGVKFLFPVTLGVENFDLESLTASTLPNRIEQASFLPGAEIELPRTERWTLRVRAQVGWGTETRETRESAWIYTAGVRSRLLWPDRQLRPAWISGLQWAGYKPKDAERNSMSKLSNGVELDVEVPRWQFRGEAMHLMPHVLYDWYFDSVDFFSVGEGSYEELDAEWEIGVAAGRARPFSIFGLEFDRVGLGFRFSEDNRGIRFLFGSIF